MSIKNILGWILLVSSIIFGSWLLISISSAVIFFAAVGTTAIIVLLIRLIAWLLD